MALYRGWPWNLADPAHRNGSRIAHGTQMIGLSDLLVKGRPTPFTGWTAPASPGAVITDFITNACGNSFRTPNPRTAVAREERAGERHPRNDGTGLLSARPSAVSFPKKPQSYKSVEIETDSGPIIDRGRGVPITRQPDPTGLAVRLVQGSGPGLRSKTRRSHRRSSVLKPCLGHPAETAPWRQTARRASRPR